jgi:hypothetical protein
MAKMPTTTEETREEVEWVVVTPAAALLALFEAFMPILVIDFAGFGVGEGFVRFSYFDEFLLRGLIAWVLIGVIFLAEEAVGAFYVFF